MFFARALRRPLPSPLDLVVDAARAGDVARWRLGPRPVYQVNAPHLVQEVLVERAEEFPRTAHLTRALSPLFGRGLLISDGEVHRSERRRLAAAFAPAAMPVHGESIVELTRRWMDGVLIDRPVDIELEFRSLTLAIGARVMLGEGADAEMVKFGGVVSRLYPHGQRAVRSLVHLPS